MSVVLVPAVCENAPGGALGYHWENPFDIVYVTLDEVIELERNSRGAIHRIEPDTIMASGAVVPEPPTFAEPDGSAGDLVGALDIADTIKPRLRPR